MYTKITELLETRRNPLLLNCGDNFQGTLWYNMFKWRTVQKFMNLLPFTAYTLGNHEFDDGIAGVVPFIKTMKAPLVVSNLDDSQVPELQNLYNKSIVVEVEGKRIGIVGVILSTTNQISNTENLKFLDEVESVNNEALRLLHEEQVFTVIVISHCGYDKEMEIAKKAVKGIGLIVGAHSHTLLYTGTPPDGSKALGPYPTVIKREIDDGNVLVVQASSYTKYLGDLVVKYDDLGEVESFEGNPIYLDHTIPEDETVNKKMQPYKDAVVAKGNQVLGETKVFLDQSDCRYSECNIGNFITDAMVYYYKDKSETGGSSSKLAIFNVGGIRTSIPIGNITYNDMANCQPFENTIDVSVISGHFIKAFFEQTAIPYYFKESSRNVNLLQNSGFKIVYNLNNPIGSRVKSIKVLCNDCPEPEYHDLDPSKDYKLITASFITKGGDGFKVISENLRNVQVGPVDMDVYTHYLKNESNPFSTAT
ncbi:PREDICTED: apyrase-like [Nicrophorus vespilloides]|uniref:apyrase n=1 Tax=Nicrophorus vespilloides TaxID=110193 RepID=A0ABM1M863_NICVS|nr:PREDICTED: apyrase-like [Nicrophorus vespilloides]